MAQENLHNILVRAWLVSRSKVREYPKRRIVTKVTYIEAFKKELRKHEITAHVVNALEGVPQGQVEENELRNEYDNKFAQYIMFIRDAIKVCEEDMAEITPTSPILMTEKYSGTIKVAENHYIYIDYIARDNENNLLQQEYLTVHIQPYLMKLFVR